MDLDIKKLFVKYNTFKKLLKETFNNPDEKKKVEKKLYNLERTKSAAIYAIEFRQTTSKLN